MAFDLSKYGVLRGFKSYNICTGWKGDLLMEHLHHTHVIPVDKVGGLACGTVRNNTEQIAQVKRQDLDEGVVLLEVGKLGVNGGAGSLEQLLLLDDDEGGDGAAGEHVGVGGELLERGEEAAGVVLAEEGTVGGVEAQTRVEDALVAADVAQQLAGLARELGGGRLRGNHARRRWAARRLGGGGAAVARRDGRRARGAGSGHRGRGYKGHSGAGGVARKRLAGSRGLRLWFRSVGEGGVQVMVLA